MSDRDNIIALVAAVNEAAVLPCTAMLDYLGDTAPAASVQQLPGSRYAAEWISGGGVSELPFAVRYRTGGNDSSGRADAASQLIALADALESADLEDGWISIRGVDTPSLVERNQADGSEVWLATFMLESLRGA